MIRPWHGIMVATALPFTGDLTVDHDAYAAHCRRLVDEGCDGVVPNGSLGEYQTLTPDERARVVRTAVEAVGGDRVMPGVAAYGSREALTWAEQARDAGCASVMLLPPNAYRADEDAVLEHYRTVSKAGLPIVAYNNPIDTKVDLTPALLAKLFGEGLIVAVKEFSGDVRRAYEIQEVAPGLDLLVGSDDVVVELLTAGAKGWVAGFPNSVTRQCVELYRAAEAGDLRTAVPLYRDLHPLLRWDARVEFVQAIKLSMDVAGLNGGACRPPRLPLPPATAAGIRAATEKVM